jgi:hypothetical protein
VLSASFLFGKTALTETLEVDTTTIMTINDRSILELKDYFYQPLVKHLINRRLGADRLIPKAVRNVPLGHPQRALNGFLMSKGGMAGHSVNFNLSSFGCKIILLLGLRAYQ